ncbi:MAG: orotate phosphoribosyltransferase [Nitriliruptorales bacterium]|nr:orotate phosphoribosyltransferase [Nitriliruptorales bacterium]
MQPQDFISFLLDADVLTFGDFETKSGRRTPYFINAGRFGTGEQAWTLGRAYADAIVASFGTDFDVLFGPAYKGIPLAVATAVALAVEHGLDVGYCFDRKEAKDHGEGGVLVGHDLRDGDRVVIVEDVTTAGTSIRETVPKLRAAADVQLVGLMIAVDRQEVPPGGARPALGALADEFDMAVGAIVDMDQIIAEVDDRGLLSDDDHERIARYRAEFGA